MQQHQLRRVGVAAVALVVLAACDGDDEPPVTAQPSATIVTHMNAEEVAAQFVAALGDFDVERAVTYLSDDPALAELVGSMGTQGVQGTQEELRLFISLLEAQRYRQVLDTCREAGTSTAGTRVSCSFDYHLFGSDEIGLGPYSGSYFDLTVRDGEVVQGSVSYVIERFSPEMWEPFAEWVSTTHPDDAAVMYTDGTYSGVRISEESIRLWERHVRGYVDAVGG